MVLYEFSAPGAPAVVAGVGGNPSPMFERRALVPDAAMALIERDRGGLDLRPRAPAMPPVTMTIRGW